MLILIFIISLVKSIFSIFEYFFKKKKKKTLNIDLNLEKKLSRKNL